MSSAARKTLLRADEFEHLRSARDILKAEADAITRVSSVLDANFSKAVSHILACNGRVIVTGMGKAGLIGRKLTATFSSTGTPSHFLHPAEAVHGDLGCLQSNDTVLALSNSGETSELTALLPIVRSFGVTLIAITSSPESSLGLASDIVLQLGKIAEAGQLQLAPTTTTTAMLAMGDALALVVSEARGFSPRDFVTFHPGGSLGRKLQPVEEVMRTGEQLRISPDSETVRQTLLKHSGSDRRSGALMLIDAAGGLSGLFTDSDLARLLEQHRETQLDRPIKEVMTSNPGTIAPHASVQDAIDLLAERKISEIPVIDALGRPIGLVDITDLIGSAPG